MSHTGVLHQVLNGGSGSIGFGSELARPQGFSFSGGGPGIVARYQQTLVRKSIERLAVNRALAEAARLATVEIGTNRPTIESVADVRPDFLSPLGGVTVPGAFRAVLREEHGFVSLATRAGIYRAGGTIGGTSVGDIRRIQQGSILSDLEEEDRQIGSAPVRRSPPDLQFSPRIAPEVRPPIPRPLITGPNSFDPVQDVAGPPIRATETPLPNGGNQEMSLISAAFLAPVAGALGRLIGSKLFQGGAVIAGATAVGTGLGNLATGGGGVGAGCVSPITEELRRLGLTRRKVIAFARTYGLANISCLGLDTGMACEIIAKGLRRRGRGITSAQLRTTRNTMRKISTMTKSLKRIKSCR